MCAHLNLLTLSVATQERGHDLLITYRVYDPEGNQEEIWPDDYEPDAVDLVGGHASSPEGQKDEAEAMAAAAQPGGLSGRVASRFRRQLQEGEEEEEGGIHDEFSQPPGGDFAEGRIAAASARSEWRATSLAEPGKDAGDASFGGFRCRRYFGLPFEDEWIPATSNRIEKLNSRASWKISWTEEVMECAAEAQFNGSSRPLLLCVECLVVLLRVPCSHGALVFTF